MSDVTPSESAETGSGPGSESGSGVGSGGPASGRSGGVSRRALLLGSGGAAVVGAAAASGVAAAAWPTPATIPAVTPAEELMYDHGVLKRILLCYRELSRRLGTSQTVSTTDVTTAGQLIRDYIESFHEGLEEAYVFPRLLQAGREADLVQTLLTQHDRGRHLTAAILDQAADGLTTPAARSALRAQLDAFVAMYEPHEAWEDTVIFPAFRAVTPDRTWRLLAEQFADEQARLIGRNALATVLGQVSTVETSLGIHDLAKFTPPGVS